jgi:uncharacterized protein YndB with AHSA1/START domain
MDTTSRDDLFTHIHKALRLGLFDITAQAGRTDWSDADEIAELQARWRPLLALLRAHTAHEDDHILRILDRHDAAATEPTADQHHDLDDLLDELADQFDSLSPTATPAAGLALYRDLARFVAAYFPHLHDEETRIMARIWELCSDEEIAATRARFMADTTPEILTATLTWMLPALDRPTRRALVGGLAATAPPPVVAMALDIAAAALPPPRRRRPQAGRENRVMTPEGRTRRRRHLAVDPIVTEKFRIITDASPACAWDAITENGKRVGHLYGLEVRSTWQSGATLTVGIGGGERLTGHVLRAEPPWRLSYTLGPSGDDPSVYVTWDIQRRSGSTIVRLYVDEPGTTDGTDIELGWTPVLAALERELDRVS